MPREVLDPPDPTPSPSPRPIEQTSVPPETTERQMGVFSALRSRVAEAYVYPDFNGVDWESVGDRYEALIAGGLSDPDFYSAMDLMIAELGDEHSYFQSPDEVAEEAAKLAKGENFVGIGTIAVSKKDNQTGTIMAVFAGSPAAEAGLRPHDLLLEVDGQPYRADDGTARSLGPAARAEYQRRGEVPRHRNPREVSSCAVDYCIVPETQIGYIMLPTFLDENVDDQVRAALQKMTADGPLDGLILDNRLNGGGSNHVLEPMLGFFTSGGQGSFVSRDGEEELNAVAEDIGGTQDVPLIILVDRDTMSFAEIFAGVLQKSGRATLVGGRTAGNVENLTIHIRCGWLAGVAGDAHVRARRA
jgi:C-terminal peptidase prc